MKKIIFLFLILAGILSCERKSTLQSGIWRGELSVAGNKQAPFLFEVNNDGADTASVTLINGEERVVLSGVTLQGYSVVIPIVAYDAVIKGVATDDAIEGRFIKNY